MIAAAMFRCNYGAREMVGNCGIDSWYDSQSTAEGTLFASVRGEADNGVPALHTGTKDVFMLQPLREKSLVPSCAYRLFHADAMSFVLSDPWLGELGHKNRLD